MKHDTIILEVIINLSDANQTTQLCNSLTNTYFTQLGQANTPVEFGWGPNGDDVNDPIKIAVGSVEYLLSCNLATRTVALTGACNSGHVSNFSVSGQTLVYSDGMLQFTTEFELAGGNAVAITVTASGASSIAAKV